MERMWEDIVVISFEGVTEFCGTFFSVRKLCDSFKGHHNSFLPHPFRFITTCPVIWHYVAWAAQSRTVRSLMIAVICEMDFLGSLPKVTPYNSILLLWYLLIERCNCDKLCFIYKPVNLTKCMVWAHLLIVT